LCSKNKSLLLCRLGGGKPIVTEKVIVDLPEIADMHCQEGRGLLNERFEDLGTWFLT
jgi:hypothetical protein